MIRRNITPIRVKETVADLRRDALRDFLVAERRAEVTVKTLAADLRLTKSRISQHLHIAVRHGDDLAATPAEMYRVLLEDRERKAEDAYLGRMRRGLIYHAPTVPWRRQHADHMWPQLIEWQTACGEWRLDIEVCKDPRHVTCPKCLAKKATR